MLLEMLPPEGENTNADALNSPSLSVRGRLIEQQYYSRTRVEREAWNAERIAEAEPIVSAVERRCHQEHLFNRILVETNLQEAELRSLLERIPPPQEHAQLLQAGQLRSVTAWREALGVLAEWLKEDARQRKAAPGHAPTPTLKAIYSILVEAMDHALLPVIIGSYGIGKSYAAKLLVDERPRSPTKPGAVRVKLRSADDTVSKCIDAILQRLRHDSRGEGGYAGLCRMLRRGDLLILDEAQHLAKCSDGRMVEVVRDLWDETGAAIALIGNPVMKRGKGGDGIIDNDLYGAFLNRAEVHDFTKGNSRADVEAWMLWKGLSGKVLADKLAAVALRPSRGHFGGLRELEKLFAQVARRNPGETVTAGTMLEALKVLGVQS